MASSKTAYELRRSQRHQSSFEKLPTEVILHIISFLEIDDVVRLSKTSNRLHAIISTSQAPWVKAFKDHDLAKSGVLVDMVESALKRRVRVPCKERAVFDLHKKIHNGFENGVIHREDYVECLRPSYPDFGLDKVATLTVLDFNMFHLQTWNPVDKETVRHVWKLPEHHFYNPRHIVRSVLAFKDDIVVVHTEDTSRLHDVFGLQVRSGNELLNAWSNDVDDPARSQVAKVGNTLVRIVQLDTVANKWDLDVLDVSTGEVLKEFKIDGYLLWGQENVLRRHDDTWLILATHKESNPHDWRLNIFNVDELSYKIAPLSMLPNPPTDFFDLDVHVRNGKIFAMLPDKRIPVWDAQSGNLDRIFSIPDVPDSVRGIISTDFSTHSKCLKIFVQTNRRGPGSAHLPIEFTAFQPSPLPDTDMMDVDHSKSFNFNSRFPLRRIEPAQVLASEFVLGHFVVVFYRETTTEIIFNVAVMSNNANFDLGNLRFFHLMSAPINQIDKQLIHCKITPSHIVFGFSSGSVVFDFSYFGDIPSAAPAPFRPAGQLLRASKPKRRKSNCSK